MPQVDTARAALWALSGPRSWITTSGLAATLLVTMGMARHVEIAPISLATSAQETGIASAADFADGSCFGSPVVWMGDFEFGEAAEDAWVEPDPVQRAVAKEVASRYRIAADFAMALVADVHVVATETGLAPLLLLAVIGVESSYNPIAESGYGAQGLMQVVPRFHAETIEVHGGEDALLDPHKNVRIGAHVLRKYIEAAGGVEDGLQRYGGASRESTKAYSQRVLKEQAWLERAAAAQSPQALASVSH